jgi:IS30 family transposase
MSKYKQITHIERATIGAMRKSGSTLAQIATAIGKNKSSISREIHRNYSPFGYCCNLANDRARGRRHRINAARAKLTKPIKEHIDKRLLDCLSPEQISGTIQQLTGVPLTHQTIYRYVHSYEGQSKNLKRRLRRKGKRYIRRSTRNAVVRNRPSIDDRPPAIQDRQSHGDWEADIMQGPASQRESILVLVERKSRFTITRIVPNLLAETVSKTIVRSLHVLTVNSITYDNGSEFANYLSTQTQLEAKSYFCHPYSSWEKGTVENTIGLLREFYPKGTKIDLSPTALREVTRKLNCRPRKVLNYNTPASQLTHFKSGVRQEQHLSAKANHQVAV